MSRGFAKRITALLLGLGGSLGLATGPATAQEIHPERGVDPKVDYAALAEIGPWDDRNYQLTAHDLNLLSPNETELGADDVPAFYRIELKKRYPQIGHDGVFYPRATSELFRLLHKGYLVDGQYYTELRRERGRLVVATAPGPDRDGQAEASFPGKQLAGDVRVSPLGGAESSIKIHPVDKNRVIAGANDDSAGQQMYISNDGGSTWTLSDPLPTSDQPGGVVCCDPTIEWSANGSLAYTATLGRPPGGHLEVWFYRSSDNGSTWTDLAVPSNPDGNRREITAGQFCDKEFLHVDRSPDSPYKDNIYLTWHELGVLQFSRSTDFGDHWSTPTTISQPGSQYGIGSDITSDRYGNLYYVWPSTSERKILVARSTNGGASFSAAAMVAPTLGVYDFPIPSMASRRAFIYAAADADLTNGPFANRIYIAWTDTTAAETGDPATDHARVQVAYSGDQGLSWTVVTPHGTEDSHTVDRFHPWIAVDGTGSVHLIYYDTSPDPSRTSVRVMHQRSDNGGQSWTSPALLSSAVSPVISNTFQLGDYNGLDVVGNLALASFTDNRNEAGGNGDSVDVYAAAGNTSRSLTFQSIATEDGYILESSATSGVGGFAVSTLNSPSGLRVGDAAANEQIKAILSFDTSALPDGARVTDARLRLKRGTVVGTGMLGLLLVGDVKAGSFGSNSALTGSDFQAAATVNGTCAATVPAADGLSTDCVLEGLGRTAINLTGLTQMRLHFIVPDNGNSATDYVGFYPGEAAKANVPRLIVTFEPQ